MGAHMVDLIAEYAGSADVALLMRPTVGGRRLLDRAAALGARTVELPSPRDPRFADVVTGFLGAHPADVFHCHVGTGCEDWDGVRLARRAGCGVVVQTQHLPFLVSHPRKRRAQPPPIEGVHPPVARSDGPRRTHSPTGAPPPPITTRATRPGPPPPP